jgi:SAM-dependent methyltransferase
MAADRDLTTADRVMRLLQHLGIVRAHFVMGAEVAAEYPEVVASLALLTPHLAEIGPLQALAAAGALGDPPLIVHSDAGPLGAVTDRVLAAYPGAATALLRGYASALWSDVVAERRAEVAALLLDHLAAAGRREPVPSVHIPEGEGEVAGIAYRARGSGPPLLLFPLYLSPSQWEPIVPALAAHYCTIVLGGSHLGLVTLMEERAAGGYGRVVDRLLDALAVPAGGSLLEIGCASGALCRRAARCLPQATTFVGVDVNAYFVREATALARRAGLSGRLTFREGDAEALPFPDASFDAALAPTVLEEVDADRALAELVRVVRPGGRIAVIVNGCDLHFWDNLPLPPALRAKARAVAVCGGNASDGCADASLYRRVRDAGLTDLALGPEWGTTGAAEGLHAWRMFYEAVVLARMDASEAEKAQFRTLAQQATADGTFLWSWPYHCAVGTRP